MSADLSAEKKGGGSDSSGSTSVRNETQRRRTFAIISHPDAGKTTLTEKLLLYSGMIRTAGMVRGRKTGKKASSDWMAMEQERGISITASAMQFEYKDAVINVLDTPGHQDFSEDTYRTLMAADSAIMVIDAAKGVEAQTRKLFAVCAMRGIPVLTFVNKMDLPGRDPFELVAEVEDVLGIDACPINWPVGSGREFRGVADCDTKRLTLFEKTATSGAQRAASQTMSIEEAIEEDVISDEVASHLQFELELLDEAGNQYDEERFLSGKLTRVYFGSALTNFGLEPFFNSFIETAPPPGPRLADFKDGSEGLIDPCEKPFSAFVFKIQSNMDPKHRDSMAFLRICSGEFKRESPVVHVPSMKEIRLSRSHRMFGGERDTIDSAFPGDIVGVINPGVFSIGDTISSDGDFSFKPLPQFSPEVVARIRPTSIGRRKAFDKGIAQLCQEGAVQVLYRKDGAVQETLVAAVGSLQFEVLQFRLSQDYQVETALDILSYKCGAWLVGDVDTFKRHSRALLAEDAKGRNVMLFQSEREKDFAAQQNPDHTLVHFVR
jgi:peptide chain release factor 3